MAEKNVRDVLGPHKLVGVDTMTFIYHIEGDKRYEPFTRVLFKSIEDGERHAVTSTITLLEALVKPKMLGDEAMWEDYHYVLTSFPNLKLKAVDEEVAEAAASIRASSGLRTPDALQVATCVVEGASAFVTNDDRLKKIIEPKIIVMSEVLG